MLYLRVNRWSWRGMTNTYLLGLSSRFLELSTMSLLKLWGTGTVSDEAGSRSAVNLFKTRGTHTRNSSPHVQVHIPHRGRRNLLKRKLTIFLLKLLARSTIPAESSNSVSHNRSRMAGHSLCAICDARRHIFPRLPRSLAIQFSRL
jgi:hypothetical protein